MTDLPQGLPPVTFPTLGWQVIDWIENFLCHGPGDVQGDRWEIDDEIALHICWVYRVWPQGHARAGRRLIHRDILSRSKGRAKSEIAGGLVCVEALGPVRCDGFDANGDPVGVPVTYPFIRCLATEEEQSGNTYDNVHYMLTNGSAVDAYALDVGLTRTFIHEPGGGEIRPSTAGDASKDGGKESFSVADETHLYTTQKHRGMYRTVARNTGKRKIAEPWMLDTTTAWQPGERSIAEQAADKHMATPVEDAVTKRGVLFDHRQGDVPKRFGDDRSLIKAMRPAYGPAADWMDFHRIVQIIRDAEDPEGEAYRYFLNRPRKAASHWLIPEEIVPVLGTVEPDPAAKPKEMITYGFDGSETDDHTVLFGCRENGDLFTVGVWTPVPGDLGWRDEVTEAMHWLHGNFKVLRAYWDPPWWNDELARFAAKYGSPPLTEFWTHQDSKMAVACGALRTEIRRQTITIDPDPILTEPQVRDGKSLVQWHFENARVRKVRLKLEDRAEEAHVVQKQRPGSPLKIDSVPSAVLARRARDDAFKAGEFKKKTYGRAAWR